MGTKIMLWSVCTMLLLSMAWVCWSWILCPATTPAKEEKGIDMQDTKTIDGIKCKKNGSRFSATVNICPECDTYSLGAFCEKCGHEMGPTFVMPKCPDCGNMATGGWCRKCGSATKLAHWVRYKPPVRKPEEE